MKFVPNTITQAVGRQALLASKHSPTLLFGAGVVGMVGSTVLACRATLKLEEVVQRTQSDLQMARVIEHKHSQHEHQQDVAIIYFRGVRDVVKLYAPSVLVGAAGVACLTKSHNILQDRYFAATAAYATVDEAFRRYRERVIEKYGEEEDRLLRYEHEEVDIIDEETGEVTSTVRVTPGDHSMYSRWFDDQCPSWNEDASYNYLFLQQQQNWANDLLNARGHVFLNEVYGMLGIEHTTAGALVGWMLDRSKESVGDNYIDFGIYDHDSNIPSEFFTGREGAILLDFNVDGSIYNKIDDQKRKQKFLWKM